MNNCPICGAPLGRNKTACSMACYSIYRQHKMECINCGKLFYASPSSMKVTCSLKCSREHRVSIPCKEYVNITIRNGRDGNFLPGVNKSGPVLNKRLCKVKLHSLYFMYYFFSLNRKSRRSDPLMYVFPRIRVDFKPSLLTRLYTVALQTPNPSATSSIL